MQWLTSSRVRKNNLSPISPLQNLHFIPIWIGHEGHLLRAGGKFLAPAGGPDFEASLLDAFAVGNDVVHAERGVHQVLGAGRGVFWRVAEFEENVVSREFEEGEAVALRRGLLVGQRVAEFFVKRDGGVEIADTDTGMEETDHGGGAWGRTRRLPNGD